MPDFINCDELERSLLLGRMMAMGLDPDSYISQNSG